ncbi:MAG: hypothetical protein H7A20_01740 [Rhodanobacteraceae bacterium]|nr:hypothetical protein [Rhodanobacteraceae bacterium]
MPEADLLLDKRLVSIRPVDGRLYLHLVCSVDVEIVVSRATLLPFPTR